MTLKKNKNIHKYSIIKSVLVGSIILCIVLGVSIFTSNHQPSIIEHQPSVTDYSPSPFPSHAGDGLDEGLPETDLADI